MMRPKPLAALAVAALLLAAACTESGQPDGSRSATPTPTPSSPPVHVAELDLPAAVGTVVPGADATALAAGMSAAVYRSAPVAVVAPADDAVAQLRAASVAVALGAPMLLDDGAADTPLADEPTDGPTTEPDTRATTEPTTEPTDGPTTEPAPDLTDAELERLGVLAVVTVGSVTLDVSDDVTVIPAPDDDDALAELIGVTLEPRTVEPTGDISEGVNAVASLDRDMPELLARPVGASGLDTETSRPTATPRPTSGPTPTATPTATPDPAASSALPLTDHAQAPDGTLVLTTGDPMELAAVATARAAAIDVITVPDGDPRTDSDTVQAFAAAAPTTTIAVGDSFGTSEELAWKVATATTGVELPGGGQTVFAGRRMVAMYGTPTFPGLGILGEQDVAASIARVQGMAAEYQALTTDLVVPAFEIIVTIASAGAGDDGNYTNELPVETFVPWIEAALDAGVYVVLDLQPGRTDFVTQARAYEQLLLYPNVGLALDPEWRLGPDQVHLVQIGSVGVDEVNAVADYLAELTRTNHLPQKTLVLHQFMQRMIVGRESLDMSHDELAVLIHVDGQGSQGAKNGTWQSIREGAPAGVAWGWKNFIDEDVPVLTPAQTYQVVPLPDFVSYQ